MYKVFDFSFDSNKFGAIADVKFSLLSQIQAIQSESDLPVSQVEVAVPATKEGKTRGFGYLYFSDYKLSELVFNAGVKQDNKSWPTTPVAQRRMTSSWADEVEEESVREINLGDFHITHHDISLDNELDTNIVMTKGPKHIIEGLMPEILRRLRLFTTNARYPVMLRNYDNEVILKKFEFDRSSVDGYYAMLFMRVSHYELDGNSHTLIFIHPKKRN